MAKSGASPIPSKSLRAAIYVRVSTQYQIDKDSLPVQRQELINYAKYALNIDSYAIFEDAGYSAKNTDRPDYQRMIARIRTGEFTHLLVWKIDRISRNLLDFAAMYAELKRLGVTFVSKNEQFDTSSAIGEAMLKIILVFAELERNMTSERVSAVLLSRANNGEWNGGHVSFGYKYDSEKKEFSIIEDEANVVRYIYDLYESLRSLLSVSKTLNDKGFRTRNGKLWNPTTVRTILTHPFYSGTYRYNYYDITSTDRSFVKDPDEWILVENHHPAIVAKERQDRMIAILRSQNRKSATTYQRKNIHIFAGLLRCGYCNSSMPATVDRARSNGWRPSIYMCSSRRRSKNCQNKYVSDISLGPFVLNFIANLIKASNSFGKTTSIFTFEKKLLRGKYFEKVDHIERVGLEELYNHLKRGFDEVPFESSAVKTATANPGALERDALLAEKRKVERAIERLQSVWLFGEKAISEKDYLLQYKQLKDSLQSIDLRLKKLDSSLASDITISDEEFIAKASYFILTQQLQDKRFIDYERFIRKIDPKIVKDFLRSVITNFCIKDGLTTSILFRNGIEIRFSYKRAE